jgi:hypothetical protein
LRCLLRLLLLLLLLLLCLLLLLRLLLLCAPFSPLPWARLGAVLLLLLLGRCGPARAGCCVHI